MVEATNKEARHPTLLSRFIFHPYFALLVLLASPGLLPEADRRRVEPKYAVLGADFSLLHSVCTWHTSPSRSDSIVLLHSPAWCTIALTICLNIAIDHLYHSSPSLLSTRFLHSVCRSGDWAPFLVTGVLFGERQSIRDRRLKLTRQHIYCVRDDFHLCFFPFSHTFSYLCESTLALSIPHRLRPAHTTVPLDQPLQLSRSACMLVVASI